MSLTETQLGVLCAERLKLPHSAALGFQTYIGSALNNLALDTVNDAQKRRWLITDPSTTTATVTSSSGQYYVDLSTLIASPQIMIDYLNYGTIYAGAPTKTWVSGDVTLSPSSIEIAAHGYVAGTAVKLTTTGALPSGLSTTPVYYIIVNDADDISFATTYAKAVAGTNDVTPFGSAGSGTGTVTPYGAQPVLQWLTSPNQGNLTSAVPIAYPTGWLVDTKIYLNNVTGGTLSFAVPFVPSLQTLPQFLENDVLDQLTNLAIAAGAELPKSPAEK